MPTAKRKVHPHELPLRDFALTFPETHEDFPWGERALKVKGKVFVFMGQDETHLSFSVKLPVSGGVALSMGFAEPTHYGLGKSGWVTFTITPKDKVPLSLMKEWVTESYRAVAPKTLAALVDEDGVVQAPPPPARAKKKAPRAAKPASGPRKRG